MKILCLLVILNIVASCGSNNIAEPYTELTTEEKAKKALDAQEFTTAITLYEQLISDDQTAYSYYRFLAAAYAGAGGFEVLSAIKQALDTTSESSGSIVDLTASLLPADPSDEQITFIGKARDRMLALPIAYRDSENSNIVDSASAAIQLSLYSTASAMIIINKYTYTPGLDGDQPPNLEEMTDAEVDQIFANLEAAASQSAGDVSASIESSISEIDNLPGASRREKLISYMQASSS